jgi:adenosylhomocysteine nucleosidase
MDTAEAGPILAVAAEAREFAGLLRHASTATPLDWPLAYACEALIGARRWLLAADGPGPRLARRAAAEAFKCARPRAVLSTGLCGALDPALHSGELFLVTGVQTEQRQYETRGLAAGQRMPSGTAWSCDRVVTTRAEKGVLRARGAAVVEMEAAAVAEEAEREETPFYCVRVISDEAHEDLPLDFNRYRDEAGRFSRLRIAAAVAVRPWLIGRLSRFDTACRHAAQTLGDFLADCQF